MIEPFKPKQFESECVVGARQSRLGYSVVFSGDQKRGDLLLHRVMWVEKYGEIPAGVDLHHECGNRACINVEHLKAMPRSEHMRMHHLGQRKCDHGEAVRFRERNQTVCRVCRNEGQRRRRARARAA